MTSVNELMQSEAIRHQTEIRKYTNAEVLKILAVLNRADRRMLAELAERLERMSPATFTMERLEAMLTSVRMLSAEATRQAQGEFGADLRDFVSYEAEYQTMMLTAHVPVQVSIAAVNAEAAYAAAMARPFQGVLLRDVWQDLDARKMKIVRQTIAQGFVESKTTDQVIRELRGTRAKGYADGLLEAPRKEVEAVVRTALSHTAGMVQDRAAEANADIIKAVKWSATLDLRTSKICRPRDGKLYHPVTHKPIGHDMQWLGGPGRAHWRAVVRGTPIRTKRGLVPVEEVVVGDEVLTHLGRFKSVTATLSKPCDSGVVRVAHTKSGRMLRATDDHPVLTSAGWRFMGALKLGDHLACDQECLDEVVGRPGKVVAESEDCPAVADEAGVAFLRTLKLLASTTGLEGDLEFWAREVEDVWSDWVLGNPEWIKGDQCAQHHLLSLGQVLLEVGCDGLSKALTSTLGQGLATHALSLPGEVPALSVGSSGLLADAGHMHGVAGEHARRVLGVGEGRFLCLPEGPMFGADKSLECAGREANQGLLGFAPNRNGVLDGEIGEAPIGESELALNCAERFAGVDVVLNDQRSVVDYGFAHDVIDSLEVQEFSDLVFDLTVEDDASYIASGVVVSNCRSGQAFVLKSMAEMGIDAPDVVVVGKTRASMDGQVPADTTYGEWLKGRTAAQQDKVLGETRGRLFRQGKLPLERMYDDKGSFLTLDELRARDAEAFRRAGL
jgi:hypothetical protein